MKIRLICIIILILTILSKKSLNKKKKASFKKAKLDSKDNKKATLLLKDKEQKKTLKAQSDDQIQTLNKIASSKLNVKNELQKILRKKDDEGHPNHDESTVQEQSSNQNHHDSSSSSSSNQEHHDSSSSSSGQEHHETSQEDGQHSQNQEQSNHQPEQKEEHKEEKAQSGGQNQEQKQYNVNEEKKVDFNIENKDKIKYQIKKSEEQMLNKLEDQKRLQKQTDSDKKLKGLLSTSDQKNKKPEKVYVLNPVPYKSKFVNGSRPLPPNNTPIPNDWEDASYVKQISTYSKKFLRDINDPKKKQKAMLVGKPLYIENNITFDDQPILLQESAPHMTGVNVVQRQYATQEKSDLWSKWLNGEFRQNFKDVAFNSNDTNSYYYNSGIEDVINGKSVKISLTNKNKAYLGKPQNDTILAGLSNPIKRVVYTKEKQNELIVDKVNLNTNSKMQDIKRMKQNKRATNSRQDDKSVLIKKWVDPNMRK